MSEANVDEAEWVVMGRDTARRSPMPCYDLCPVCELAMTPVCGDRVPHAGSTWSLLCDVCAEDDDEDDERWSES